MVCVFVFFYHFQRASWYTRWYFVVLMCVYLSIYFRELELIRAFICSHFVLPLFAPLHLDEWWTLWEYYYDFCWQNDLISFRFLPPSECELRSNTAMPYQWWRLNGTMRLKFNESTLKHTHTHSHNFFEERDFQISALSAVVVWSFWKTIIVLYWHMCMQWWLWYSFCRNFCYMTHTIFYYLW